MSDGGYMVSLKTLVSYCDERLGAASFADYCPNGLQVEVSNEVEHLVTGVTASMNLIEAAAEAGADSLLVHHGYFWKGEPASIVGMKGRRIAALFKNGLNLIAYHLPLDAHEVLGNNIQLGSRLGLSNMAPADEIDNLLWYGELETPISASKFADILEQVLGRRPLHIETPQEAEEIQRLCWCTGAAQGFIERAVEKGCDLYMSGEISENTVHTARESGIHYFAAGHHATERFGVQALGNELAEKFKIRHDFIDIPNPV